MKAWLDRFFLLVLSGFFFAGCDKYYVSIVRQNIDVNYLASSRIHTPDPRRDSPPLGEMLFVSWYVPQEIVEESAKVRLSIVFQDYSETEIEYPVEYRKDFKTYSLLGEDFLKKGGFLTYKAEVLVHNEVYRSWKQQLWVKVIHLEENSPKDVEAKTEESTNSSVEAQSKQGSVMETPYRKEELDW